MRWLIGLTCFVSFVSSASDAADSSRDLVLNFYSRSEMSLSVSEKTSTRGLEVEICSDYCDLYTLPLGRKQTALWDAVVLVKAFISDASFDQDFARSNAEAATTILKRRAAGVCLKREAERDRASCALQALEASQGLKRAAVTYDEGNRCEAFAAFSNPNVVYQSRCFKVKR